jgi:exonuclease SbcD
LSYPDLFKDFYEQYRAIEMEESGQKIVADIFSALGRKD